MKNRYYFGVDLTADITREFSENQKKVLILDIVEAIEAIMKDIMSKRTPEKLAISLCGKYKHSERHLTRDTLLVNILSDSQIQSLPARPRDFRVNLLDEQKKIEGHGLQDMLKFLVKTHILNHTKENFEFPRGRPSKFSTLAEETKGRNDSVYDKTDIYRIIDDFLNLPIVEAIDNQLNKQTMYNFLEYSFASHLYEMKICPEKFLESMTPYKRISKDRHDKYSGFPLVLAKDFTPDRITDLSRKYALVTLDNNDYNSRMIYVISALLIYSGKY